MVLTQKAQAIKLDSNNLLVFKFPFLRTGATERQACIEHERSLSDKSEIELTQVANSHDSFYHGTVINWNNLLILEII